MKRSIIITSLLLAITSGVLAVWLRHRAHPGESARFEPPPAAAKKEVVPGASEAAWNQAARGIVTPDLQPVMPSANQTRGASAASADRVKALRSLERDLTLEESRAVQGYLLTPVQYASDERQRENWLRNVMLDKLVGQSTASDGIANLLIAIYEDHSQDVVMRDYAVQHMVPAYDRVSAEDRASLHQTLWQAAEETDSSIAGTALLALADLAQGNAEFSSNKIIAVALHMTSDERCGEPARITAVQICGRMRVTQAARTILQLAQSGASVSLRMAAVAALGDLGDEQAESILERIETGPDQRLRLAAESSLNRLRSGRQTKQTTP